MGWETSLGAAEAKSVLLWWLEAGVDVPVQDEPRNWLAGPAPPTATTVMPEPAAPAAEPQTIDDFRRWLSEAPTLPLASPGARRVLPTGVEGAPLMLLADVPGPEEAAQGRPLAGDAWTLATRMLAAIGIVADDAYVASLACFHSPGARLSDSDREACAAVVRRQIALAGPKRLLLLGDGPSRALLGKPIAQARGHVQKVEGVRTVATFSPRHLIQRTADKALAWRDLLLLMEDEV